MWDVHKVITQMKIEYYCLQSLMEGEKDAGQTKLTVVPFTKSWIYSGNPFAHTSFFFKLSMYSHIH